MVVVEKPKASKSVATSVVPQQLTPPPPPPPPPLLAPSSLDKKPSVDLEQLIKPLVHVNEQFPESFEELLYHQWSLGASLIESKRSLNFDGTILSMAVYLVDGCH